MEGGRARVSKASDLLAPPVSAPSEDADGQGLQPQPSAFRMLLAELEREHVRETTLLRAEVERLASHLEESRAGGDASQRSSVFADEDRQLPAPAKPLGQSSALAILPSSRSLKPYLPAQRSRTCSRCDMRFQLWEDWTKEAISKKVRLSNYAERFSYTDISLSTRPCTQVMRKSVAQAAAATFTCRPIPIHPSSSFRMCWDFLGLLILAVDIIYIPLQVFIPEGATWAKVVDWVTLVYWSIDIVVGFTGGYYDRFGNIVMDLTSIAKRYIKGWFFLDATIVGVDLVSSSLELANLSTSSSESLGLARLGKFLRIVRILRTLRLLRLVKLRQLLYAIHEKIRSEGVAILVGLGQNLVGLLVVNHYVACGWFLVGKSTGSRSWVVEYRILQKDPAEQYLISLHWSMTQFTPATMRMFPVNGLERLFTVAVLFIAIVVFSSFVSSITSAMTRLRGLTASLTSQRFLLRKFLKENHISSELSARITRYIELAVDSHQRRTTQDKVTLLELLSGPLTISLQREVYLPFLSVHPLFKQYAKISKPGISQICYQAVTKHCLSKGDMVFDQGVPAQYMYFLVSGSLFYKRMNLPYIIRRIIPITEGMWFSEPVLWVPWAHLGSMKATIESEILTVRSSTFRTVTLSYPDVCLYAQCEAAKFLEWLEENDPEGTICDVPAQWIPDHQGGVTVPRLPDHEVAAAETWEAHLMAGADTSDGSEGEEEKEEEEEAKVFNVQAAKASILNGFAKTSRAPTRNRNAAL